VLLPADWLVRHKFALELACMKGIMNAHRTFYGIDEAHFSLLSFVNVQNLRDMGNRKPFAKCTSTASSFCLF
ncbi:hypothetical protein CEXT_558541, partial [Caerostris extrusa]